MKLQYEPVQLHLSHLYGCSPVCRRRWFIRLSDLWNNSEWMNGWMNKLMNVTYVQYMCWLFLQWVKEKVKYRKERDLLYVLEAPHYIKTDKKSWTSGMRQKKRMIGTPTLNFLPQKSQVCPNSGLWTSWCFFSECFSLNVIPQSWILHINEKKIHLLVHTREVMEWKKKSFASFHTAFNLSIDIFFRISMVYWFLFLCCISKNKCKTSWLTH